MLRWGHGTVRIHHPYHGFQIPELPDGKRNN